MLRLTHKKFMETRPYYFMVGEPNRRLLHGWFFYLNLKRLNFFLTDPLDVRNFVVNHITYTPDKKTRGQTEYWLQNAEEVYSLLRNKRDDCDGVAVLTASLLYSLGNPNIQLTLGYLGDFRGNFANHVWCSLVDPNNLDDPWLLETTGDYEESKLERTSKFTKHHPFVSCNVKGEYWIGGPVKNEYQKIYN